MLKAFKYRIYPTGQQAILIDKHIGCCRFVYNLGLEIKSYAYQTQQKNVSGFELMRQITQVRKDYSWLREVNGEVLAHSIFALEKAYKSFFSKRSKYPVFKKKTNKNSFRYPQGFYVSIRDGKLYQPKFRDGIRIELSRPIKGEIRSTTISRTPTGKYFVSILCETGQPIPEKRTVKESTAIGIDLGLKSLIVTSNGLKVDNPKHFKKALLHLQFLQRQASRKKKGSANRKKANKKVALQHEKITNQRKDFLHKLSTQLVNSHDTLCLEDLNIAGMVKNHNLAQAITDVSWGEFVSQLKYKAEWNGKNILQVPTFEPSTKLCNVCGNTNSSLTLADRDWTCLKCGTYHDRDMNAAINIKNYCLKNCGEVHRGKSVKLPVSIRSKEAEKTNV